MSRRIILAANSAWYIANFRSRLIGALREAGYQPVAVAPADRAIEQRLRDLGADFIAVPVDRSGLNPLVDAALVLRYWNLMRRLRPAALLSFTIKPNIYGCLAARMLGVPAMPTVSGLGTAFISQGLLWRLVGKLYRLAFRRAATVFFENPDDRDELVTSGLVRAGRTAVVPGAGIDLDHFGALPLPDGRRFLLIARLLGDKGLREYAEAARMVKSRHPSVRFQLLGGLDPHNRSAIERAELDRWVQEGAVEYLGESNDVRPFVGEANVVVLPSYREGLPRTLLEGAAMGRPLIASNVPGCTQVVEDGVNGFLCEPRDALSLADAIERVIGLDRDALIAMGLRGRALVEDRFADAQVIEQYLSALRAHALPARAADAGL